MTYEDYAEDGGPLLISDAMTFGEDEPDEDDGFLTSVGRLGAQTGASFAGKYLGTFDSERRARAAIRLEMMRSGFYPNVWSVSDHGNYHLTTV